MLRHQSYGSPNNSSYKSMNRHFLLKTLLLLNQGGSAVGPPCVWVTGYHFKVRQVTVTITVKARLPTVQEDALRSAFVSKAQIVYFLKDILLSNTHPKQNPLTKEKTIWSLHLL